MVTCDTEGVRTYLSFRAFVMYVRTVCVCMFVNLYIHVSTCVYICVYVGVYMCICTVCVCVCVCFCSGMIHCKCYLLFGLPIS